MKKGKLFAIAALSFILCACEHETVSVDKEKIVIDAMYECLTMTPDQISDKLETLGFHIKSRDTSSKTWKYETYADEDISSSKRVLIGVGSTNGIITSISYNVYLTYESDPATHFALISDKIATYGYSDWSGYYEDSASERSHNMALLGEYTEDAQIAQDREDLHKHINKECLDNQKTLQYYMEDFVYTHTDKSQWHGMLAINGQTHGKEGAGKDVILTYELIRIE